MIQNYKKIGDYISVVDNRNADGSITNLMGISIEKCYIPSVANVIGTDLHNYKVIRKGQFACSLMQVSRDQRIPLAMYTLDEPAIMSPAYVMFEVNRPEKILPEYMELWFKRAEFDREASFYAVGGVRGSLDWEDFCKMKLPVPSISEQRKIVHDYKVITDRIELLKKMNENLEEQVQTILKNYMDIYSYELIPLSNIADIIDCLHTEKPSRVEGSPYQLIQLDNIRDDGFLDLEALKYMISEDDYTNWTRKCEIHENDCVITNVGRMGAVSQAPKGTHAAMGRNMTCIRLKKGVELQAYLITLLLSPHMKNQMQDKKDVGTIMEALNVKNIPKLLCPSFENDVMMKLENSLKPIVGNIQCRQKERQVLEKLRTVFMANISRSELSKGA